MVCFSVLNYMIFLYTFVKLCTQVVGANKGGVVALVEGLRGFVPFSQISTVSPVVWIAQLLGTT